GAGPALVRVPSGFVAILGARRGGVALLGPDHAVRVASVGELRELLCGELERAAAPAVDAIAARVPAGCTSCGSRPARRRCASSATRDSGVTPAASSPRTRPTTWPGWRPGGS